MKMFEEQASFFVLGAGASYPHVPIAEELGELTLQKTLGLSIYPANRISIDRIANRIVGNPKKRLKRSVIYSDDLWLKAELSER